MFSHIFRCFMEKLVNVIFAAKLQARSLDRKSFGRREKNTNYTKFDKCNRRHPRKKCECKGDRNEKWIKRRRQQNKKYSRFAKRVWLQREECGQPLSNGYEVTSISARHLEECLYSYVEARKSQGRMRLGDAQLWWSELLSGVLLRPVCW